MITNLPESHCEEVEAKVFPGRSEQAYKVRAWFGMCRVLGYDVVVIEVWGVLPISRGRGSREQGKG